MAGNKDEMIIDRVDDSDNIIGPIKRGNIFREQANFRTVHVFVFNSADELLLQKLASEREEYPQHWGSSAAGYVKSGESYEQAAMRKLSEELGIEAANLELVGKTAVEAGGAQKFVTLFKTRHDGPFKPHPEEIEEVQFSSLDKVKERVAADSNDFTPTFLTLFDLYLNKE